MNSLYLSGNTVCPNYSNRPVSAVWENNLLITVYCENHMKEMHLGSKMKTF